MCTAMWALLPVLKKTFKSYETLRDPYFVLNKLFELRYAKSLASSCFCSALCSSCSIIDRVVVVVWFSAFNFALDYDHSLVTWYDTDRLPEPKPDIQYAHRPIRTSQHFY